MAWKHNLDLKYDLVPAPWVNLTPTLGAEAKTRLESRIMKFTRYCMCRWSGKDELMCPKSRDATLHCPNKLEAITPYPFEKNYTEGDALQWVWFVPHDPEGLVALFNDNVSYVKKLNAFIADSRSPAQVWQTLLACSPCLSSSKHHAVCMGNDCLDLINMNARVPPVSPVSPHPPCPGREVAVWHDAGQRVVRGTPTRTDFRF